MYKIIGIFFRTFRDCLNECGYKAIKKYKGLRESLEISINKEKSGPETEHKLFSEIENCEYVPLVA